MYAAIHEKFSASFSGLSLNLFKNTLDDKHSLVTPHWHERLEIIHILKGRGTVTVDFRDIPVSEEDIVIIPPSVLHSVKGSPQRMSSQTVIFTLECIPSNREYESVIHKGMPGHKEMTTLMNFIFQSNQVGKPQKELLLQGYVTSLYGLLVYHRYEHESIHQNPQDSAPIKSVITYIQSHYKEKISLDMLAQISGYSKYYFTRYFFKHTGLSCTQYIKIVRLERARKLLLTTDWNISVISNQTGFESVSYFIKVFKSQEGISPMQYRMKQRTSS